MTWRTMETAPKDGTWIIAYEENDKWGHGPTIRVVQWGPVQWTGDREDWVTDALGPNPDTMELSEATHWMPLPEPPPHDPDDHQPRDEPSA